VLSDHFLCGNYGNMLIMSKTCHASVMMSVLDLTHIMLSCGISSIVQNMSRWYSLSPNKQGYGQQSFVKSIGGEESPSASDCIALHDQYDLASCAS